MKIYLVLRNSCLRQEHILKRFAVKYGMKNVDSRLMKFGILWGEFSGPDLSRLKEDILVRTVLC